MTSRKNSTLAELAAKAESLSEEIDAEITAVWENYLDGRREFYRERGLTYGVETETITGDDHEVEQRELPFLESMERYE